MTFDHDGQSSRRHEAWRLEREAKRAAWRARRAARHARRGEWGHLSDPKFWGLDPESMKQWGFGTMKTFGFTIENFYLGDDGQSAACEATDVSTGRSSRGLSGHVGGTVRPLMLGSVVYTFGRR